jgi:hypothetical protein
MASQTLVPSQFILQLMNLITDRMLDNIAKWPNGLASVSRSHINDGFPRMSIHICLRVPPTQTGPEIVTEFFLVVVMNRPECKYHIYLHTGDTKTVPAISALIMFADHRSASVRIHSIDSRFDTEAPMILRFLHPLILRFDDESLYDEKVDGSMSEQNFFFDQSTVASLNDASGFRFGVMVMELRRLLQH